MRIEWKQVVAAAGLAALAGGAVAAEESFDACAVFTQEDAQKVIGKEAAGEPVNPKAKRPKMIPACTYHAVKDGNKVSAMASFKFGKPDEVQRVFDDARMKFQTKPMLIDGADAFWSAKTGEMTLRKGRALLTVAVGPQQLNQRDMNEARRLAEILARKL